MSWRKVTISFLFLSIYLGGSAHNLIPHSQGYLSNNHKFFTHEHHQHTSGQEEDDPGHHHVLHKHHFDDDLFDFFVCLLNETKHSDNTCNIQHYLPVLSTDLASKKLTAVKLFGVLTGIGTNVDPDKTLFCFSADTTAEYLSPVLANSPYRGPPIN